MAKNKSYAVIGLGRYGKAVARELLQNGAEVLAIDMDPEVVNANAKNIPHCKCADVTNPEAIRQLGIADMDAVIIAIAGMEGALASVVGGLADCPVIAVPTSVGYGASFGGVSALLSMLNSCASGVSVVNIDNGFGAGYLANMINHMEVRK